MAPSNQKDIRSFDLTALESHFAGLGEPPYRAAQVYRWLWRDGVGSIDSMTNLSKNLREHLKENFILHPTTSDIIQKSLDGTIKIRFVLYDGNRVEGVLIPALPDRFTACISSQAGCSLTCIFCATGTMGIKRNLSPGEIYDQVTLLNRQSMEISGKPLTNIVLMGMGEPLLNYKNVMLAIGHITSPDGLGISPRRITVSTAGIAKMIRLLGDDMARFNLALSLHSADEEKRSRIMPINKENSLESLKEALKYFHLKTGSMIRLEYILFEGFNDSREDALQVVRFCSHFPAKVNLIEYNPIAGASFKKPGADRFDQFAQWLKDKGIFASVRRSRGKDIDAACGQLANVKTR